MSKSSLTFQSINLPLGSTGLGTFRQETIAAEVTGAVDVVLSDTLNFPPTSADSVLLSLNGVTQEQGPGADYTLAGQTITWLAGSGTAVPLLASDTLIAYYVQP